MLDESLTICDKFTWTMKIPDYCKNWTLPLNVSENLKIFTLFSRNCLLKHKVWVISAKSFPKQISWAFAWIELTIFRRKNASFSYICKKGFPFQPWTHYVLQVKVAWTKLYLKDITHSDSQIKLHIQYLIFCSKKIREMMVSLKLQHIRSNIHITFPCLASA